MPPQPKKNEATKAWLRKAAGDLGVARYLLERTPPFCEHAVFCCQQSAEKSIKAVLVWKSIGFEKIHDLAALIAKLPPGDSDLKTLLKRSEKLSPFAVIFRYPGEDETVSLSDAREALVIANEVFDGVLRTLPKDTHPD